jgi:hypothetical protein
MTAKELDQLMTRNELRQVDVAWMCGVGVRHARSWTLSEYEVPQYAQLLLKAFDQGLITDKWLHRNIDKASPKAAVK